LGLKSLFGLFSLFIVLYFEYRTRGGKKVITSSTFSSFLKQEFYNRVNLTISWCHASSEVQQESVRRAACELLTVCWQTKNKDFILVTTVCTSFLPRLLFLVFSRFLALEICFHLLEAGGENGAVWRLLPNQK